VSAFSVCIGAAPNAAGCFYHRALAYAAMNRSSEALQDYDRTLQIDPTHAAAALNRAMIHFQQRRSARAIEDLHLALRLGADAATVHYDLALVHLDANDTNVAMRHVELGLERNPAHAPSRLLRDRLQMNSK